MKMTKKERQKVDLLIEHLENIAKLRNALSKSYNRELDNSSCWGLHGRAYITEESYLSLCRLLKEFIEDYDKEFKRFSEELKKLR